jgi:hypothetical protein
MALNPFRIRSQEIQETKSNEKIGVILLNLGGPEKQEVSLLPLFFLFKFPFSGCSRILIQPLC